MFGAICGDIIGSIYESKNIKSKNFELFTDKNRFTDDSVMTCAIALACSIYKEDKNIENFEKNCILCMKNLGLKYINAGYGGKFIYWILSKNPKPYNSYGNGSAMRVSPVAWIANSLEEAEILAEKSARVSHNHPFGIIGAKAVASSIWLLLNGTSKEELKEYIQNKYYNLDFTLSEIRDKYVFDVSCQGSVPQAIVSFLEANSFEDCIRNAISIGGDSDTIAAIAGSLAEAYYGVPDNIKDKALTYLDNDLLKCVELASNCINVDLKFKNKKG